jgi:hypothetical protein
MSPEHATNWLPGLLMLAAGAVVALAYLFGSKRLKEEPPNTGSVDDLNVRYQAKLAQLKDHLASKHLGATDWAEMKQDLEREAAAILRERDGAKHAAVKAVARAEKKAVAATQADGFFAKNPTLKGALIGGGVVGFFVLLGTGLSNNTADRKDGMGMTGIQPGAGPMQGGAQQPEEDPKLVALAQRVQGAPDDADAVAELALYLVRRQAFEDAKPLIDRVTLLDPFQTRGRVSRAVMRAVDGDVPGSVQELEHLADYYPDAYDARMFAGLISIDQNDPARAIRNLEAYLATAPPSEQPPFVRMTLQQLRSQSATP